MNSNAVLVGGEIATRATMELFEYARIGGVGGYHSFEKNIVWLIESETQLSYWHGGVLLKEDSTFTDYYGYLRSMDYDQDLHFRKAKQFSVNQKSTLEMKLTTRFKLVPFIENEECFSWNSKASAENKRYKLINLPRDYSFKRKTGFANEQDHFERLSEIEVDQEVIWCSYLSEPQNEERVARIKARWQMNDENRERLISELKERMSNIKVCY